jgi:predicted helicase
MNLRRTIAAIAATAGCGLAFAQNLGNPPPQPVAQAQAQAQALANAQMEQMTAMMGKMMESLVAVQSRVAAKPEVAEAAATFKHNLYDALRKKGFTAQEALQIVVATPLPAVPMGSK